MSGKKGQPLSEDHKQKIRSSTLGRTVSQETRDKISVSRIGIPMSIEQKRAISVTLMGHESWTKGMKLGEARDYRECWTDARRQKHSKVLTQVTADEGWRKQRSASQSRLWQNPEYVAMQMRSRGVSPNKLEVSFGITISPFGFRYVGDGQLIIAGKCPDFWDGNKKLIELYGDYWHLGQNPQDRIDLFKAEGYDCLVIWEHELKDFQETVDRIARFCE